MTKPAVLHGASENRRSPLYTDTTLAANNTTVWWNGKARSLKKEDMFVNVTQGIFFVPKSGGRCDG